MAYLAQWLTKKGETNLNGAIREIQSAWSNINRRAPDSAAAADIIRSTKASIESARKEVELLEEQFDRRMRQLENDGG